MTTLVAQCSNCASWRIQQGALGGHSSTEGFGHCARGLFPASGELLCAKYEISRAFQQQVISTMMREQGPMAMPVKLMGGRKSARAHNKKLRGK